jgi:hypothetical protein
MKSEINWNYYNPKERKQIEMARSRANYKNPFSGKNTAQRRRLHSAFWAMK